jgi:ABC-type cobalamin transport system ATPase subunit
MFLKDRIIIVNHDLSRTLEKAVVVLFKKQLQRLFRGNEQN